MEGAVDCSFYLSGKHYWHSMGLQLSFPETTVGVCMYVCIYINTSVFSCPFKLPFCATFSKLWLSHYSWLQWSQSTFCYWCYSCMSMFLAAVSNCAELVYWYLVQLSWQIHACVTSGWLCFRSSLEGRSQCLPLQSLPLWSSRLQGWILVPICRWKRVLRYRELWYGGEEFLNT